MPSSTPTPIERIAATVRANWRVDRIPAWVMLPLRLFLGVTFVYAGIQKLTDPQFFNPSAPGYIGRQLMGFAIGSPLHGFLLRVAVPHAALFGGLVAYGELAVGLGVLAGFLARPAAVFGALLSFIFFLTASWRVRPYFYGPDIVFFFAWLPIIFAGPEHGILPTLDPLLARRLLARVAPARRAAWAGVLAFVLGTTGAEAVPVAAPAPEPIAHPAAKSKKTQSRATVRHSSPVPRRDFIWGAVAGAAGMLGLTWIWNLLNPATSSAAPSASATATTAPAAVGTASATAGPDVIATVASLPVNSAATFTVPANGDPGVVVHTSGTTFVAFDAICTHNGCTVAYDPSSKLLLCPCHGAAFDPTQNAQPVQGPTNIPLTPVAITVNNQTGDITVQQ
jgi:thiosulfate dehydrogenase [quinone] large subunit